MTSTMNDQQQAISTINAVIKDIETAMLTTVSDEGLVSRPMQTQDIDSDGTLWFLTKKDTSKFHELLHNQHVNVAYAGKSFVSIRGTAELVEDKAKLRQIWNPIYEKLLETNVDDPNLILIRVHAHSAEYWDQGNMFRMVKFLFSRAIGKNTEGTEINQTVSLV